MRRTFKNDMFSMRTFFDGEGQGSGGEGQGAAGQGAAGQGAGASLSEDRVNQIVNGAIKGLETKLTKSFGDTLNPLNEQLTGFGDMLKSLVKPPGEGQGSGSGGQGQQQSIDPQVTARLMETERKAKTLEGTVTALQEENKQAKLNAEKMDRQSRIRAALGSFSFVSDEAADTAFALMEQGIRRDSESGNLIGGPEGAVLPFDIFIKEALHGKHAYLLGTKGGGGMGAVKGDAKYATSGQMVGTTEMIKPGMRPEERAAVVAQIQAVGQALHRGSH